MVKKGDFVEIEYTGRIKEENTVFDTTDEKTAKESSIYDPKAQYGPIIVCIGQSHVLKGLDESLENKDIGKEYKAEFGPEKGFGKKDAKLIRLVSTSKFTKQNINPVPGLQINMDGAIGTIRTVSGGRTLVDLNHPLSGRDLVYKFKILRLVDDDSEKLKSLLKLNLGIDDAQVSLSEGTASVALKKSFPSHVEKIVADMAKNLIPGIKALKFSENKKEKPTDAKQKPEEKSHEKGSSNGEKPSDKP